MDTWQAILNDDVIAQGSDVRLERNVYVPPSAARHEYLRRIRSKSLCPWKGVASCYTLEVEGLADRNAAWTHRTRRRRRSGSLTASRSGARCASNEWTRTSRRADDHGAADLIQRP
jgi:hypothetical protein